MFMPARRSALHAEALNLREKKCRQITKRPNRYSIM